MAPMFAPIFVKRFAQTFLQTAAQNNILANRWAFHVIFWSAIIHHTNPPCPALPGPLYPIPGTPLIYSSSYHYTLGVGVAGLLQVPCEAGKEAYRERKPPRRTHLSHGILTCCQTLYNILYMIFYKVLCKINYKVWYEMLHKCR